MSFIEAIFEFNTATSVPHMGQRYIVVFLFKRTIGWLQQMG